jgi:hypothetical protein
MIKTIKSKFMSSHTKGPIKVLVPVIDKVRTTQFDLTLITRAAETKLEATCKIDLFH